MPVTLLLLGLSGSAGSESLSISDGNWDLRGPGITVGAHEGRDVISVETGRAYRRGVRFEDGTLEFDVQLTRRRSFVYVTFRMADDREHEEVYLRPHKSGLPDSLQYSPVHQGQSAWQLHHGPGATAATEFEPGAWTRLRLVLKGRQAALFVGDLAAPVLLIPRLAREPRPGYIALGGFLPPGTPGQGPIARFANITLRPGAVDWSFPAVPAPPAPAAGVVQAWSVSRAWVPDEAGRAQLPPRASLAPFTRVQAEPSGLVELHRFVKLPENSRSAAAVASVSLKAAREGSYAFELGFSDQALVFVNGRPLFQGEGRYSFDGPRREGLIGYDQARLWLPLAAGENELAVLVSDGFGGWGLMGRFPDPSGLEIGPH